MNLKNVKRLFLAALIAAVSLGAFSACSSGEKPSDAVSKALTAVKTLDESGMKDYFTYEELMNFNGTNKDNTKNQTVEDKEKTKFFFANLSCKIVSSTTNKDTATVKAQISNLDMKSIMEEYFNQAVKLSVENAFSGTDKQLSQEELTKKSQQILVDLLSKKGSKTVTATVDIALTKKDKKWKITMTKELQDAMTGGLSSISEKLNQSSQTDSSPKNKLSEIADYMTVDIWNKGFCDISAYMADGKSSTGESLDIDFTLTQLDTAYKKKAECDKYIQGLDAVQFKDIKNIWSKLSSETDVLYNKIKGSKPQPNKSSLDTGKFTQYRDAFADAVDSLK